MSLQKGDKQMLTLSIVRHAKSSWGDPGLRDIDRPLNDRGKGQAQQLGNYMSDEMIAPDLIICSSAKRARQTLKQMKKNWLSEAELIIESRLYLASPNTITALLGEYGQNHSHIMIIGHNPGLHMLAHKLAVRGDDDDLAILQEKYPTGTLCGIRSKADKWKKIGKAAGTLIYLATPRQLATR